MSSRAGVNLGHTWGYLVLQWTAGQTLPAWPDDISLVVGDKVSNLWTIQSDGCLLLGLGSARSSSQKPSGAPAYFGLDIIVRKREEEEVEERGGEGRGRVTDSIHHNLTA